MKTVNMHDAKTNLSRLVAAAGQLFQPLVHSRLRHSAEPTSWHRLRFGTPATDST